jgi:hypothetical protein
MEGRSDTEHHDLSGFDQGGDGFAFFQAQLAGGVGSDDGGDDLAADGETDLGEEAFDFEIDDAADELIAAADGAHHLALRGFGAFGFVEERVQFRFGNAVVTARGFDGLELAAIDPLLDGGVGDAEAHCCFARGEKRGHATILYENGRDEYADVDDISLCRVAREVRLLAVPDCPVGRLNHLGRNAGIPERIKMPGKRYFRLVNQRN